MIRYSVAAAAAAAAVAGKDGFIDRRHGRQCDELGSYFNVGNVTT